MVGLVILGSEVPLNNGACGADGRVSVFTRVFPYAQVRVYTITMHRCTNERPPGVRLRRLGGGSLRERSSSRWVDRVSGVLNSTSLTACGE